MTHAKTREQLAAIIRETQAAQALPGKSATRTAQALPGKPVVNQEQLAAIIRETLLVAAYTDRTGSR